MHAKFLSLLKFSLLTEVGPRPPPFVTPMLLGRGTSLRKGTMFRKDTMFRKGTMFRRLTFKKPTFRRTNVQEVQCSGSTTFRRCNLQEGYNLQETNIQEDQCSGGTMFRRYNIQEGYNIQEAQHSGRYSFDNWFDFGPPECLSPEHFTPECFSPEYFTPECCAS